MREGRSSEGGVDVARMDLVVEGGSGGGGG